MSDKQYWDSYYVSRIIERPNIPSQFAVFVANEYFGVIEKIVEFGCGSGRDARFFAGCGFDVYAIDQSESAIRTSRDLNEFANLNLECIDVLSCDLIDKIVSWAKRDRLLFYARFFLHAINEAEENLFFKILNSSSKAGDLVALEFRTVRDRGLSKLTGDHYRRYINPLETVNKAINYEFDVVYYVEGFGFAKYKMDDAYVARFVMERR